MDERKNKMTDERYREILPVAYMTAAIVKGRQPRPVEVGLCARAIVDAEDENNLAYRVAMATKIHCTIVGVKRVPTKANSDKYEITYRTLGRDEDEMIPSPLLNGFPLGKWMSFTATSLATLTSSMAWTFASSRMMVSLSMSISAGAASWSRMAVGTFPISIRPVA